MPDESLALTRPYHTIQGTSVPKYQKIPCPCIMHKLLGAEDLMASLWGDGLWPDHAALCGIWRIVNLYVGNCAPKLVSISEVSRFLQCARTIQDRASQLQCSPTMEHSLAPSHTFLTPRSKFLLMTRVSTTSCTRIRTFAPSHQNQAPGTMKLLWQPIVQSSHELQVR